MTGGHVSGKGVSLGSGVRDRHTRRQNPSIFTYGSLHPTMATETVPRGTNSSRLPFPQNPTRLSCKVSGLQPSSSESLVINQEFCRRTSPDETPEDLPVRGPYSDPSPRVPSPSTIGYPERLLPLQSIDVTGYVLGDTDGSRTLHHSRSLLHLKCKISYNYLNSHLQVSVCTNHRLYQ